MRAGWHRHRYELTLLLVAALGNAFCAIDRGASRTRVSVDGEYGYVGNRSYGCEGELLTEQFHHQVGGKAAVRYEHRHGFLAQVDGGLLYGKLASHFGFEPQARDYWMGTLGALVGYDFKYFGFDLGFTSYFDGHGFESIGLPIWPRATLRAGVLEKLWGEIGVGPFDAPFDGRGMFLGLGLRQRFLDLRFGIAVLARPMMDLDMGDESSFTFGQLTNEGLDVSAYAMFNVQLGLGLGLDIGAYVAETPSFKLGLSYDF